jgi:hypothetical protein
MAGSFTNGRKRPVGVIERDYYASGDWKCPQSPTGGHWWDCNSKPFVCKICGKVKAES